MSDLVRYVFAPLFVGLIIALVNHWLRGVIHDETPTIPLRIRRGINVLHYFLKCAIYVLIFWCADSRCFRYSN
ncbi:type I toxin-antitoxin system Fst family toxin [Enterococcus gilvus]|uniref:type I toxin-antitoxin system Fst family toxin n=1 Tax=Enterococcus gilvus TaxID=160453 RepID=UPI0036F1EE67